MKLSIAYQWIVFVFLCCFSHSIWATTSPLSCSPTITYIAAAKAVANSTSKPTTGWEAVTLPDLWTNRWPKHDGDVWYRIDWTRDCTDAGAKQPIGVGIDSISLAGAIYSNDTLLWRDHSLEEPLSLSWNMPRWWLLPETTLSEKSNTLWVRTIGLAELAPGLGKLQIDHIDLIAKNHAHSLWHQRTVYYISLGLNGALGGIFLVIWIFGRSERAYGWYGLMSLCWMLYLSTLLSIDPWPFPDALTHSRFNNICFILYVFCFCLFTWRFGEQKLPYIEKLIWVFTGLSVLLSLFAPRAILNILWLSFVILFLLNCLQFQFHAWRSSQPQYMWLAICWLFFFIVGVHDLFVISLQEETHTMWGAITGPVAALFTALLLGGRLASSMRHIETFNYELQQRISAARLEITELLSREHNQALAHATLEERMHIIHDLHDSIGSSLVRSIALVEQASQPLSNNRMLSLLKVLRDDLRQVIEQGGKQQIVAATPTQWLAPLRHRFTDLLDEIGISSHWDIAPAWVSWPSAHQCLGLTRLIEESISNVIKHSQAKHLRILLKSDQQGLSLIVDDDGVGFDVTIKHDSGVGMRSMAARVERMGGKLQINSSSRGTTIIVFIEL